MRFYSIGLFLSVLHWQRAVTTEEYNTYLKSRLSIRADKQWISRDNANNYMS